MASVLTWPYRDGRVTTNWKILSSTNKKLQLHWFGKMFFFKLKWSHRCATRPTVKAMVMGSISTKNKELLLFSRCANKTRNWASPINISVSEIMQKTGNFSFSVFLTSGSLCLPCTAAMYVYIYTGYSVKLI